MTSARLAAVEALLCERYNVRVLDGPLKEAIDADDVAGLRALLDERDLYRWRSDIYAALPSDEVATPEAETATAPDLAGMTKAELLAFAETIGVEVSPTDTKAEIIAALTPADDEAEEPATE